jgi:hypothetical protein
VAWRGLALLSVKRKLLDLLARGIAGRNGRLATIGGRNLVRELAGTFGGAGIEALAGAQQLLEWARAAGEKAYLEADYDLAAACFLLARVLEAADRSEQALFLLNEARQRFEAVPKGASRHSVGIGGLDGLRGTGGLPS